MAASFLNLPPELIAEILALVAEGRPPKRILTLASTSRAINEACVRIAYRNLCLHDLDTARQCCETLAFNQTIASCVRRFSLVFLPGPDAPTKSAFTAQLNRLLRSAFQNMSCGLVTLELRLLSGNVNSCLNRISFPYLKTFYVETPLNAEMALFLQGHPDLVDLRIRGALVLPAKARGTRGAHRSMVIPMTKLKNFSGPPGACAIFLPGSQVHDVEVNTSGEPDGPDWESGFIEAILKSKQEITSIGFNNFHYRHTLFNVIGDKLGGIQRLTLGFTYPDTVSTFIEGLMSVLPGLTNLYYFRLLFPSQLHIDYATLDEELLDLDYAMLRRLSEARETLSVCDLLTVTWARLEHSGQWLPVFPSPAGIAWWFQRTPLTMHLQRRIISHLASKFEAIPDEDPFDERAIEPEIRELAKAVGFLLNRAFGLPAPNPSEESDEDTDEDTDDDDDDDDETYAGERKFEQLRVPVRDTDGSILKPYDSKILSKERWDLFASIIGFITMHPIPMFIQNMAMFDVFMPPVLTPIPVLSSAQKELMIIIMDVLYNSFGSAENEGIRLKRYFRNPSGVWGESKMTLGVDMIAPIRSLVPA